MLKGVSFKADGWKGEELMNILFLTLADYKSIYVHGLYSDLLRQFIEHGDTVYMVSSSENANQQERIIEEPHSKIVKVPIMTMQKTNIIKKGLSMLTIDGQFERGIKNYLGDVKFDLVLYPTPPITLLGSVKYIKSRDHAVAYLLLKDIFPQNAVDIGMMSKSGVKGLIYRYFRQKERQLYKASDFIGCMSKANVEYILKHNPQLSREKVEVCPNSVEVLDMSVSDHDRTSMREKYDISIDKKVFVFGGNLGKPQGIAFMIECLRSVEDVADAFFLIIGDGTEYSKIEKYLGETKQENVRLMKRLPREDYDTLVGACDVGMIFLDHRFTIPNYPSRIISYMQAKIPVLAVTDPNTDIGEDIVGGEFGWWCESNNQADFRDTVVKILQEDTKKMGENGFEYLKAHFAIEQSYDTIMRRYEEIRKV